MATKTVRIDIRDNAREGYRAFMIPVDAAGSEDALFLPYNPDSYTIQEEPKWVPRNIAGARIDRLQWTGNGGRVLSYEHVLTVQNVWKMVGGFAWQDEAELQRVENLIARITEWATKPTIVSQRPTFVRINIGTYELVGPITALSCERLTEDPDGIVLTARLSFQLTESQ